jgi:uncharacterized membrane protein
MRLIVQPVIVSPTDARQSTWLVGSSIKAMRLPKVSAIPTRTRFGSGIGVGAGTGVAIGMITGPDSGDTFTGVINVRLGLKSGVAAQSLKLLNGAGAVRTGSLIVDRVGFAGSIVLLESSRNPLKISTPKIIERPATTNQ